ncbi:MAG: MopE-related protein, partial [Myxococcota bacterium]
MARTIKGKAMIAAASAAPVTVESTPPTAQSATIVADGCGTFTCEVQGLEDIDPSDADSLSVVYRWQANGEDIDAQDQILRSSALQPGDTVRCIAAPTDGTVLGGGELLTGAEVSSDAVIVEQPLASVASATILPGAPVVGDTLQCVPSGWDATACGFAPRYGFRWFANDTEIPDSNAATLTLTSAVEGDRYRCEAIALSGVAAGPSATSPDVLIGVVDPGAPVVELIAEDGADGNVTCSVRDLRESDLTNASYVWQLNDDETFIAGATLGPAKVSGCDRVRCTIELPGDISSNTAELLLEPGDDCDGGVCQTGSCDPEGGCTFTPITGECDDGSACTGAGTCVDGVCESAVVDCDDNNPCTADSCSPVGGCIHEPLSEVACDDGDTCTTNDRCVAGVCSGANTACACENAADCDDGNACTSETCASGSCQYTNLSGSCDDGNVCTTGEMCVDGVCQGDGEEPCTDLYLDADGDGFGVGDPTCSCGPLAGFTATQGGDCDDSDPNVNPDAEDLVGDGVDSNCDQVELCYVDSDNDGFRTDATVTSTSGVACSAVGEVGASAELDCDDTNPNISPGTDEIPGDGVDSDCNELELCYLDQDRDGFRSSNTEDIATLSCAVDGYADASAGLDCNDGNPAVNPTAEELSDDGVDSNCDMIELFNGNALRLDEPLEGETYDVGVSGDFGLGPFGTLTVTG